MLLSTLAAFAAATNLKQYRAAKRLAAKLEPADQLAIVDAAIDAHYRIHGTGVAQ